MNQLERLIEYLGKYYYSMLLMFIVELTALIIAVIYVRKSKIGRFFIFYIVLDFCILIVDLYLTAIPTLISKFRNIFSNYTNPLIALTELGAYYYFFSKVLSGARVKTLMELLGLFYFILIIIFVTTKFSFLSLRFDYISYFLGVIEFLLLLPPCFVFFYQLINSRSELKLFERPSFWIVTGIFFFSIISIPYYLLDLYFADNHLKIRNILSATLYYLPFTLNFVFLIKAFLCKKMLTT